MMPMLCTFLVYMGVAGGGIAEQPKTSNTHPSPHHADFASDPCFCDGHGYIIAAHNQPTFSLPFVFTISVYLSPPIPPLPLPKIHT